MARALSYGQFYKYIDLDRFYEAIEFEVLHTDRRGNDVGYCPDPWKMHSNGDTTGKFAIHQEKKVYNCWVCGGGRLLDLVMAIKDWDEEPATEWLYQFADESQETDEDFLIEISTILRTIERERVVMPHFNEHVLDKWTNSDWPDHIHGWFAGRGIYLPTIEEFKLGYGLVTKWAPRRSSGEGAGQPIDDNYTGPAVVFPHYWKGRLVGWQNRWLDDDRPKWVSKYTNTGDFPREITLYNLDNCTKDPMPPVICESVATVLFCASWGVSAIATFGSTVTDEQMRLLRRFQQGIILAPDNDDAGRKWAGQLRHYLDRYIPVYELPPVKKAKGDIGDFAPDGQALFAHLDRWF